MVARKSQQRFFWIVLFTIFLVSGGHILATSASTSSSNLIINEFMAANGTGLIDEDGDNSDWIEIYNPSNHPVNLSGWSLTDDLNQPNKWTFPNITLSSHDYLIVFASGKNRKGGQPGSNLHTNFKLSKTDQYLALHNILDARFMDVVALQELGYLGDVAYGRHEDEFGYFAAPTPGRPNEAAFIRPEELPPVATFSQTGRSDHSQTTILVDGAAIEPLGPHTELRITEIMYNPQGGNDYEFIELMNTSHSWLDIAGASFTGIEYTFQYNFPSLAPGQLIVLVHNQTAFAERYPEVRIDGVYDRNLSNRGEQLALRDLQGNLVASVVYDDENGWPLSPDGLGDSLVLVHVEGNPNNPNNWRASAHLNGSPGWPDQIISPPTQLTHTLRDMTFIAQKDDN